MINSTPQTRLIGIGDLPTTMWSAADQVLSLPPDLIWAYVALLEANGLRQLAETRPPEVGAVGGTSMKETSEHLAWAYAGSTARVQLAVLDPKNHMPQVADVFAKIFAGNKVLIADVPCGSGAAGLAILTTLAELRRQNSVPREPLDIVLVGGEISDTARAYADEAYKLVLPQLEQQAIFVNRVFIHWDVCNALSNTDLIKEITVRGNGCGTRLLIVANFSNFLQRAGKFDQATPQLEEFFRHARGPGSSAVWIEPRTNVAIHSDGGLFARLGKWLTKKWASFIHLHSNPADSKVIAESSCLCNHPLINGSRFEVNLAVLRCDLQMNR